MERDPRRIDHNIFIKHRINFTKRRAKEIENNLSEYVYKKEKVRKSMDKFIKTLSVYGTDESGNTGVLLREFTGNLRMLNSYRNDEIKMLLKLVDDLRHLKQVYRKGRKNLKNYIDANKKAQRAKQSLR